ncbi:hypothetical protein ABH935_003335 [Catenulispora sp. GAS73]|uniref:hypothetical protein n=1 Tax=Catenulispora sp. GAS73 TaxID=3156269 RepID=UPI003511BAD9
MPTDDDGACDADDADEAADDERPLADADVDDEALGSADTVGEPADELGTDDESPAATCGVDPPPLEQPATASTAAAAATAIVTPRIRPTSHSRYGDASRVTGPPRPARLVRAADLIV